MNNRIAELFFEARMLKLIPRSGFHFLGAGKESIAEHSFMTAIIGFVMSHLEPTANPSKLIMMCLWHDMAEARTGDLNTVQKEYVTANEQKALQDLSKGLPFESQLIKIINEFNEGESLEARLARDADQLSLIVELKAQYDLGFNGPKNWIKNACGRLRTDLGKSIAQEILFTRWDSWWLKNYVDTTGEEK